MRIPVHMLTPQQRKTSRQGRPVAAGGGLQKGLMILFVALLGAVAIRYQFRFVREQQMERVLRHQERLHEQQRRKRLELLRQMDQEGGWEEAGIPARRVEFAALVPSVAVGEVEAIACSHCQGRGVVPDAGAGGVTYCPICLGVGAHQIRRIDEYDTVCHVCGGMGRLLDPETEQYRYCRRCDGRGLLRRLSIALPAEQAGADEVVEQREDGRDR